MTGLGVWCSAARRGPRTGSAAPLRAAHVSYDRRSGANRESIAAVTTMGARDQLEPIETASRDVLAALQLERLQKTLRDAYAHVPHYNKKFAAAGCIPPI